MRTINLEARKKPTPRALVQKLLPILQPSYKLFKTWHKIPHYHDEIQFFHYGGVLNTKDSGTDGKQRVSRSAGYSIESEELALLKFLGESMERYALDFYKNEDLISGSYSELKKQAIDIFSIVSISEAQRKRKEFQAFRYSDSSNFRWVKGVELKSHKPVLLPAQLVYLSYEYIPAEPILYLPISTGAAGGFTLESAITRGICEIVERDAFLIFYLNKLSPPKIDLKSTGDERINMWLELFGRYNLEVNVLDITTEIGIPTFLSLIIDRTGIGASVSLGLKTDINPIQAILGSLAESQHPRCWIRRIVEDNREKVGNVNPIEIMTLEERALYWFPRKRIRDIKFLLLEKTKYLSQKDYKSENGLRTIMNLLFRRRMNIYYKEIIVPRFRELGYRVVRVIIPQLTPFYLHEKAKYLGGKRLYSIPVELGFLTSEMNEKDLNKVPQPFL